jgi:hypothetical protein
MQRVELSVRSPVVITTFNSFHFSKRIQFNEFGFLGTRTEVLHIIKKKRKKEQEEN